MSDSAQKVGEEILVNTSALFDQNFTTITGLSNGGFVVSWQDQSGTLGDSNGSSIKAQVYDSAGTKVGGEFLVNTQTASNQNWPTIAGLSNGSFVVSWNDYSGTLGDASGSSIKAQIFTLVDSNQPATDLLLTGGASHEALFGYGGNDTLDGNGGNDVSAVKSTLLISSTDRARVDRFDLR